MSRNKLLLILLASFLQADGDVGYDSALKDYKSGNYAEAIKKIERLDDARAHTLMGRMYEYGEGVPVDCMAAGKSYSYAAIQGDCNAFLNISEMSLSGHCLKQKNEKSAAKFKSLYEKCNEK